MDAVIGEIVKLFPVFIGFVLAVVIQQRQIGEQGQRIKDLESEVTRLTTIIVGIPEKLPAIGALPLDPALVPKPSLPAS